MRRADLALLALSLASIAALAVASDALHPPLVALGDLQGHEGRAVTVEAMVARSFLAGPGSQVLELADGTGRASAFWEQREPLEGARVRVEGAPERARGRWELRAWGLEVREPASEPLSVADAARLAPALAGKDIAVRGELRWPPEGGPELRGDGARLPLAARGADLADLVGAPVTARGRVTYEASRASYTLEAWEVAR